MINLNSMNFTYINILAGLLFLACANNPTDPDPTPAWQASNTGLDSKTVQCIAPSSSNGDLIYIGTLTGVYRSNDGGANWSARNTGLTSQDAKTLVVHHDNDNLLFLGTWGKGVFKSGNGGTNWQKIWPGDFDPRIYKLALGSNGFLWAATKNGLYKSADQGANWELIYDDDNILTVSVNPSDPREVVIGVQYSGNFKTTDNGNTWTGINDGIYGDPNSASGVLAANCITYDPVRTQTLYLSTGSVDLYKSINGGGSWQQVPEDKSDFKVLTTVIDPGNNETIWAGTAELGIWVSTNSGASWQERNDGLETLQVKSLAFSAGTSPRLFAGTAGGGVYIYSD